mgnify:CR=1 FL=1
MTPMRSLDDIREEYEFLDGDGRYRLLIELGRELDAMPDPLKTDATKVRGCSASVWVYPVIDDTIEVDIQEKDVRTDTYRASGAGGQHINKTDSAVRLTHMPTGIVVAVQAERSQHKNRAQAWDMLRARLYEMELKKREAVAQAEADSKTEIGWGRQIRSYVLQPYQMVKDLRTGVETSDTQGVLDGKIDEFLSASLSHKLGPETVVEDLD